MSTGRFFPGLVILCFAPLGFASGPPKHVKLEVRLDQMLSSETSSSGDRFSVVPDRDVTLGDKTVRRKGASVQGVVREAESALSSQVGGLELLLSSVVSEGKNHALTSNPLWSQETRRQALRTSAKQRSRAPSESWPRASPRTYRV
jgi:hypothetical protein